MGDQRQVAGVLAAGEGFAVENPLGGVMTFKATSRDTGGVVTAIDTTVAPGDGPPLHVHVEDELIYTLEGAFRIRLGDTISTAAPGAFVFIPAGTPHTFQNIGTGPGRLFATVMPAARPFEEFFERYAELPETERGIDAFARLGAETGALEVVGPPLAVSHPR
jgi:quercetin dioxygenase-like cupin family protein